MGTDRRTRKIGAGKWHTNRLYQEVKFHSYILQQEKIAKTTKALKFQVIENDS